MVIGFLTLEDFLAELEGAKEKPIVRVEAYYKGRATSTGTSLLEFFVVAAAEVGGEGLMVARFSTGSAWEFDEKSCLVHGQDNQKAKRILTDHLERLGYEVRPGIIAGCEESKTVASTTLWRRRDRRLVAQGDEVSCEESRSGEGERGGDLE